jgi:hypothetical protein
LFCPFYCDTIYQIVNDSAYTIRYIIKQKKSLWEKSNEKLNDVQNWRESHFIINENYTALSRPILETERFVYYPINAKRKFDDGATRVGPFSHWYDKEKEISFTFEDDPDINQPIYHFVLDVAAIYDNYFAGIIHNISIEYHRSQIKEKGDARYKNKELKDLFLDENPDMEVILMLYKFKDTW